MPPRIKLIFIAVLLLISGGCTPNPQPPGLTPIPTLAPKATGTLVPVMAVPSRLAAPSVADNLVMDSAVGAHIYQKNCTPCHGIQGQGSDAPPLRNNDFIQVGDQQEIVDTIADGRQDTEMPAWLQSNGGPLDLTAIGHVIAYLDTLQAVSALPTSTPVVEEDAEEPKPTPGGPTPEPARPSNPGDAGRAVTLDGDAGSGQAEFGLFCAACHGPEGVQGVPDPGSEDGAVPELNPIDSTIANADPAIFAVNVDLFVEHGSVPEGNRPRMMMPPFGDNHMVSDQQVANLIAYVIHLNPSPGK